MNNQWFSKVAVWLVIALVLFTVFKQFERTGAQTGMIGYSDFLEEVRAKRVRSVTLQEGVDPRALQPDRVEHAARRLRHPRGGPPGPRGQHDRLGDDRADLGHVEELRQLTARAGAPGRGQDRVRQLHMGQPARQVNGHGPAVPPRATAAASWARLPPVPVASTDGPDVVQRTRSPGTQGRRCTAILVTPSPPTTGSTAVMQTGPARHGLLHQGLH